MEEIKDCVNIQHVVHCIGEVGDDLRNMKRKCKSELESVHNKHNILYNYVANVLHPQSDLNQTTLNHAFHWVGPLNLVSFPWKFVPI